MISEANQGFFHEAPALSREDQRLVETVYELGRPIDDLPYTDAFDELVRRQREIGDQREYADLFHRVLNLRKAGRMPSLGRSDRMPIVLSESETELLFDLIAQSAGTVGQRDRLPYTPEFDRVVEQFNRATNRHLSAHDVWRLVARVAKFPTSR